MIKIQNYPRKDNVNSFFPRYHQGSCPVLQLQIRGVGFDSADKDKVYTVTCISDFLDMTDSMYYTEVTMDADKSPFDPDNIGRVHVGSNDNNSLYSKVSALDARLHLVLCTKKHMYKKYVKTSTTNDEYQSSGVPKDMLLIKEELSEGQWDRLAASKLRSMLNT